MLNTSTFSHLQKDVTFINCTLPPLSLVPVTVLIKQRERETYGQPADLIGVWRPEGIKTKLAFGVEKKISMRTSPAHLYSHNMKTVGLGINKSFWKMWLRVWCYFNGHNHLQEHVCNMKRYFNQFFLLRDVFLSDTWYLKMWGGN